MTTVKISETLNPKTVETEAGTVKVITVMPEAVCGVFKVNPIETLEIESDMYSLLEALAKIRLSEKNVDENSYLFTSKLD